MTTHLMNAMLIFQKRLASGDESLNALINDFGRLIVVAQNYVPDNPENWHIPPNWSEFSGENLNLEWVRKYGGIND